jgi:hypothetical protein
MRRPGQKWLRWRVALPSRDYSTNGETAKGAIGAFVAKWLEAVGNAGKVRDYPSATCRGQRQWTIPIPNREIARISYELVNIGSGAQREVDGLIQRSHSPAYFFKNRE